MKQNGFYALTCFVPGSMHEQGGEEISDRALYERRNLKGGIGYSEEKLMKLFINDFSVVEFRRMNDMEHTDDLFGKSFLWAALFRKK